MRGAQTGAAPEDQEARDMCPLERQVTDGGNPPEEEVGQEGLRQIEE